MTDDPRLNRPCLGQTPALSTTSPLLWLLRTSLRFGAEIVEKIGPSYVWLRPTSLKRGDVKKMEESS